MRWSLLGRHRSGAGRGFDNGCLESARVRGGRVHSGFGGAGIPLSRVHLVGHDEGDGSVASSLSPRHQLRG